MRLSVYANFHIFVYTIILHVYIFGFLDRRKWNRGGSTAAAEYTPEKEKRYLRRRSARTRGKTSSRDTSRHFDHSNAYCFSLSALTMHSKCDSDRPNRSSFQTTSTSPGRTNVSAWFSPNRSSLAPEALSSNKVPAVDAPPPAVRHVADL